MERQEDEEGKPACAIGTYLAVSWAMMGLYFLVSTMCPNQWGWTCTILGGIALSAMILSILAWRMCVLGCMVVNTPCMPLFQLLGWLLLLHTFGLAPWHDPFLQTDMGSRICMH